MNINKECANCRKTKPEIDFKISKTGNVSKECIECKEKFSKKVDRTSKEYIRKRQLKYSYGIDLEYYNHLFESQEGKCAICKTHQIELEKTLSVDHCHKTNIIRGLLCGNCNTVLGMAKDNITTLENAISYLKSGVSFSYKSVKRELIDWISSNSLF